MKTITLFLLLSQISITIYSQEPINQNIVSCEFGGAAITISVNYQRLIFFRNRNKIEALIGVGYFPLYVNNEPVFGTLNKVLGLNYLHSFGNNHIEASISNCFAENFDESVAGDRFSKTSYILSPALGYRFQDFTKNSVIIHAGYSPLFSLSGISSEPKKVYFRNYFRLGIGYSF